MDELETLRAAIREIYEVWAGSECFITTTAPEAYQKKLIGQMKDRAAVNI